MRKKNDSHSDKRSSMRLLDIVAIAGSLGLSLFVCICVGVAIGRFIDVYTGTSPWGLILFSLIGAVSGFWTLYKKALSYEGMNPAGMDRHRADENRGG